MADPLEQERARRQLGSDLAGSVFRCLRCGVPARAVGPRAGHDLCERCEPRLRDAVAAWVSASSGAYPDA